MLKKRWWMAAGLAFSLATGVAWRHARSEAAASVREGNTGGQEAAAETHTGADRQINLSTSKRLHLPVPGDPQRTNSFPTAAALSLDGRYLAVLNNGYGTQESGGKQSIAVLDLQTNHLADFPDSRLAGRAQQTYFLGLGFSADGRDTQV